MQIFWEVWNYLTSVDGAKFLSAIAACVTILSGGYGLLKAYRYGERQIGYRLGEFLAREEKRLAGAREVLGELVRRPNPSQETAVPTFSRGILKRALRRMGWGWWKAADNVAAAAIRCEQQVSLAKRQTGIHEKEQALSHLLLGALADARSDHAEAFAEFKKALELDKEDTEALEYAGLELLHLSNPDGAIGYFEELAAIARNRGDNLLVARALRQLALAHEQLGHLKPANDTLVWAVDALPANSNPLEVGLTHEQHGRVRRKQRNRRANQSLQQALVIYSGLNRTKEGREGVERINRAIDELNKEERDSPTEGDSEGGAAPNGNV